MGCQSDQDLRGRLDVVDDYSFNAQSETPSQVTGPGPDS